MSPLERVSSNSSNSAASLRRTSLKMEAIYRFETSVRLYQNALLHVVALIILFLL
jgi:hypothetical protein